MGGSSFPHPDVTAVMRKYIQRMATRVVAPAMVELKVLALANPGDKPLASSIKFVEKRIEYRLKRLNSLFKPLSAARAQRTKKRKR